MKREVVLVALLMVASTVVAGSRPESSVAKDYVDVSETVEVQMPGIVNIELSLGEVTITGWDENRVEVTGRVGEDITGVSVVTNTDETRVVVRLPDIQNMANLMIDAILTIRVPRGSHVVAGGLGSKVTVSNISGSVDVSTATGDISVTGPVSSVAARSVGGRITIDGPVADVEFESTMGDVFISELSGRAAGSTLDGDITISGPEIAELAMTTVTGTISVTGEPSPNALIRLVARLGGSVELTVPADVQGLFSLGRGRIDMSEFTPDNPIEWVYGEPAEDEAATQPGPRISVTVVDPREREPGRPYTETRRLDLDISVPRFEGALGSSSEFRLGTGAVRVIIEAGGAFATRREDAGIIGTAIILRTTR